MAYIRKSYKGSDFEKTVTKNISKSVKSFGIGKYGILNKETGEIKDVDDFISEGVKLGLAMSAPCNFIG